jgi:DNA primase
MENKIPEISELKQQYPLVDVLNRLGIEVSNNKNIKCFIHDDKDPSCTIYPDENRWYCHSCQLGGDQLDAIGYYYNCNGTENLSQQIEYLCNLFGVSYEPKEIRKPEPIDKSYEILKLLCELFNEQLKSNKQIYEELLNRFIPALSREEAIDMIDKYMLGFNAGNDNFRMLQDKGYTANEILSTGMFYKTIDNYFDIFINRFVFPYFKGNKIIYATSRVTSLTSESDSKAKYKKLLVTNSDHPYSLMKNVIFNTDCIRNNTKYLVIGEGTIEAYICKYRNINFITQMSKSFTNGNIDELKRLCKNLDIVYICNDNENSGAGFKGSMQTASHLMHDNIDVRIVTIPKDDMCNKIDLTDYFNSGISNDQFFNMCDNSMDYVEHMLNTIPDGLKPQTAQRNCQSIFEFISNNNIPIDNYIKFINKKTKLNRKAIIDILKKIRNDKSIKELKQNNTSDIKDPFEHCYTVSNNCIIREIPTKNDVIYKNISSFTGSIDKEVIYDDGTASSGKRVYEGNFNTSNNKKFPFKINAEDFTSTREFRKSVANICGSEANILPGEEPHVITAIQALSNSNPHKVEETVYQHTGWSRDKSIYYFPHMSVDKDMSDLTDIVRVDLAYKSSIASTQFSRFKFKKASKEEVFTTLNEGIYDGLLKLFSYDITLPCISTVFLPILLPFMNNSKKYMLWIHGTTGKGKTNLVTTLNSFYGDFYINQTPNLSWDSTAHSFENYGFYLKDALLSIDNFKLTHAPKGYHKIIHSYTDNTARTRLNSSAELKDSYPIRGVVISSGEDLPSGESSTLARLIPIEISGNGNYNKYKYTRKYVEGFQCVTPYFINWLINNYDLSTLDLNSILESKLEYYIDLISNVLLKHIDGEMIDPTSNIPRIATNIAINSIGLDFFLKFSEYMGIPKEKISEVSLSYDRCMPDVISKYSSIVIEESPTTSAINILLELITSKKVFIDGLDSANIQVPGAINIGTVRGNYVYIKPTILMSELSKITGKTFNVSNNELFRQFYLKGFIDMSNDGKSTVNIKIDGVQCRCLQFKKEVLFPMLKEPNIDMIENSFRQIMLPISKEEEKF